MNKIKDNQMKTKRTQAVVKLLAVMVMLGFACNGAWAQRVADVPLSGTTWAQYLQKKKDRGTENGLHMDKQFTKTSDNTGFLTLDTYVTGNVIVETTPIPCDIVLVLDVSGSMDRTIGNGVYTYTARNSQAYNYNGYGNNSSYYYKYNDEYYLVHRGRDNGNNGVRYLYFDTDSGRKYLSGTNVVDSKPSSPTRDDRTIWTGTLYSRSEGSIRKIDALKNAVADFINVVKQDAEEKAVDGVPMDHKISIVKFGSDYASGTSSIAAYYPKASAAYTYNSYGTNSYYVSYNDHQYQVSRGSDGNGATDVRYLYFTVDGNRKYLVDNEVVDAKPDHPTSDTETIWTGVLSSKGSNSQHLIEGNTPSSGYNNTQLVANLTNVAGNDGTGAAQLNTIVGGLRASGATSVDYGMTIAKEVLAQEGVAGNPNRSRVVVMFTDGVPTHSSSYQENVANEAIAQSKVCKVDAKVYSVGVFDNETDDIRTFMNYVSSNYPNATNMGTGGAKDPDADCYFTASNADELSNIFSAIAHASGGSSKQLKAATIVQDVITPYFEIPTGETGTIQVYKAPCVGIGPARTGTGEDPSSTSYTGCNNTHYYDENGLHFGERDNCTAQVNITKTDNGTKIQVTNFDYSANWCGGDETSGTLVHGNKLIIVIPIEAKDGVWGDNLPTNTSLSVIYPGAGEDPIGHFPIPNFTIKVPTWVEHVHSKPSTFNADNNPIQITCEEDLAWFISYVNGYNQQDAHPNANAIMMADVDMSGYNWVPIGSHIMVNNVVNGDGSQESNWSVTYPAGFVYTGTFDGNGHSIKGLSNQPNSVYATGLFGVLYGATVKNVFVTDCDFFAGLIRPVTGTDDSGNPIYGPDPEGYFGIIADTISNGAKILNSEAAGKLRTWDVKGNTSAVAGARYEPSSCYLGGVVGLVGRDWVRNTTTYAPIKANGTTNTASEVHSCMSVASLLGYKMGGLVCEVAEGSQVVNSFSNVQMSNWNTRIQVEIGGLAAKNEGKIFNCYLLERDTKAYSGQYVDFPTQYGILALFDDYYTTNTTGKGMRVATDGDWIAGLCIGNNSGSTSNLYIPASWTESDGSSKYSLVGYVVGESNTHTYTTAITNPFYFSEAETPYLYKHNDTRVYAIESTSQSGRLLDALNDWVKTPSEGFQANYYTPWFRTTAAGINDDYPVLKISDFECLASDSIVLHYGGINEMMSTRKLSKTDGKTDDIICLYENAAVTEGNNGTTLYINEDVAITQTQALSAYVGITLDNSAGASGANSTHPDPTYPYSPDKIDWHMFATSLSDAPLGVNYNGDTQHWPFTYDTPTIGDNTMPEYRFYPETGTGAVDGYFPSHVYGTEYGAEGSDYYKYWDYYCWSEKDQHYINFKRNSNSHWKENNDGYGVSTVQINYNNEEKLVPGKGYMLATAEPTFLQSHGTLNNGVVTNTGITYTENPFCVGYNLVGNPYQSYLDFDAFATENGVNTYSILNEDEGGYETYTKGATSGNRYINMHQGFFIEVPSGKNSVVFNNGMRAITTVSGYAPSAFRGEEQVSYPWVKITMTEQSGYRDYTTIEFDRPELGGGEKMMDLRLGDAVIYANYDGVGYSTFFATSDINSIPVRFVTVADGGFTLSWEMGNAKFGSIYLVDNINGQKIDMLSHNSYKFEGRASDYSSRFKIVFELTNTEEGDEEVAEDVNFAFQMDGNLVVNGLGHFEMFDNMGRLVLATDLYDTQNTIGVAQLAQGIYVLRLADEKNVKFQKIVVR